MAGNGRQVLPEVKSKILSELLTDGCVVSDIARSYGISSYCQIESVFLSVEIYFLSWLDSSLKFDDEVGHGLIPVLDRHSPFLHNILDCQV